jgi:hypothetical protein
MSKIKCNKTELEKIILTQVENLNAQGEHIRLIKEQNELLLKHNHKLMSELSDKTKEPTPYSILKKKKS